MSFLFLLKEFEEGFETLLSLQKFCASKLQGAHLADELEEVVRSLNKIQIFSFDNPFIHKGGLLDILYFYLEILLQASTTIEESILMIVEEMRRIVLRFRSKLISWKKTPALHPLDFILENCLETYRELIEKMKQFFHSLTPNFHESRTDENILIYLVEHREKLNSYLGERTIENLLKDVSRNGFSHLRTAICEGFVRRGFETFYNEKEPLLDALEQEWEMEDASCMMH